MKIKKIKDLQKKGDIMWNCDGCKHNRPMGLCTIYAPDTYYVNNWKGETFYKITKELRLRNDMRAENGDCGLERKLYEAKWLPKKICSLFGHKFENRCGEVKCLRCGVDGRRKE